MTDLPLNKNPTSAQITQHGIPKGLFGKYWVSEELGRGTSGVVYKGFDPYIERNVAIKVAPFISDSELTREDFFLEARAAGQLKHFNIVNLFDAGIEGDNAYLVMEYVPGETLERYASTSGPQMQTFRAAELMYRCANALDYAHKMGVLHRDIKPANILLSPDGTVKLADFSIALLGQNAGQSGHDKAHDVVGSPMYIAPELLSGGRPSVASDIYALGAVLYQLLVKHPPYSAPDIKTLLRKIRTEQVTSPRLIRHDLPLALSDLLDRTLSKNPEDRPQSGHAFAAELSGIFDRLRFRAVHKPTEGQKRRFSKLRFFDKLTDAEVDALVDAGNYESFAPGDLMLDDKELDSSLLLILDGQAIIEKNGATVHHARQGDCVGEIAFMTGSRRTATVKAHSAVTALRWTQAQVEALDQECKMALCKTLAGIVSYRLSVTTAKLSALV